MTDYTLITGGAGFIGGHLARKLIAAGEAVVVADNLSTGFRRNVPSEAAMINCDVAEPRQLAKRLRGFRITRVLHLSAQVSNIVSQRDPWLDFRTNVGGTINVLDLARDQPVEQIVYASSMALYGTPETADGRVDERAPVRPQTPYATSKLAAEFLVHNEPTDAAVTSLRMFNVYGPGQNLGNPYQGVISVFLARLLDGQPIIQYGDGSAQRDFVYIDDIVDCWMRVLQQRDAVAGHRLNVGSGTSVSVAEVRDQLYEAFGTHPSRVPIRYEAALPGDQAMISADTQRVRDLLGWTPHTDLDTGLRAMIAWARDAWP